MSALIGILIFRISPASEFQQVWSWRRDHPKPFPSWAWSIESYQVRGWRFDMIWPAGAGSVETPGCVINLFRQTDQGERFIKGIAGVCPFEGSGYLVYGKYQEFAILLLASIACGVWVARCMIAYKRTSSTSMIDKALIPTVILIGLIWAHLFPWPFLFHQEFFYSITPYS